MWRSYRHYLFVYSRLWRSSLATSFLGPVLFLAAMGLGLGTLVNRHGAAAIGGVSYLKFIAPGLLPATAMQTGAMEGSWPVMGMMKWIKTYHGMTASPLGVSDVLYGHLLFMATRVALGAAAFLAVMTAFGAPSSPEVLAALPVAVLTGMSIAAPNAAFTATRDSDPPLIGVFRFIVIPMFLFAGTFFPVSQLPAAVRPLAYATPLWHGVALCRALSLGTASLAASVGHVAYLAAFTVVGTAAARLTFTRKLAA